MFSAEALNELSNIPQNSSVSLLTKATRRLLGCRNTATPTYPNESRAERGGPARSTEPSGNLGNPVTSGEQLVQE